MSGLDDLVRVFELWSLGDWYREIHEALVARELEAAATLIDAMGVYYPRESQQLRDTIRMLATRRTAQDAPGATESDAQAPTHTRVPNDLQERP